MTERLNSYGVDPNNPDRILFSSDDVFHGHDGLCGSFLYDGRSKQLTRLRRWPYAVGTTRDWSPDSRYILLDHNRPWYVTKIFWDATPEDKRIFVANPAEGSRHNRGCAVDLTLYDLKTGAPIEMTGVYDEMSERSYSFYPGGTSLQRWHRDLLRRAMQKALTSTNSSGGISISKIGGAIRF